MSSSVEQAFVGRDEKRAPLKMPAWEARGLQANVSSSPLLLPLSFFFCSRSNFHAITRLEMFATQASEYHE